MSYTGIYGALLATDADRHPRIIDRERYEELCEAHEWSHIYGDQAQIHTDQESGYPRKEWDTLAGFRTFAKDVHDHLNIDRVAYNYSRGDFIAFWKAVSSFCEPFYFIHSGLDNHWPSTQTHGFYQNEDGFEEGEVFQFYFADGEMVSVERGTVLFTGFEVVDSP